MVMAVQDGQESQTSEYSKEHPIANTLAEALADVMRTKAEAKFQETVARQQVAPSPPMKTKDFSYTSIRFKTYDDKDQQDAAASSDKDRQFIERLQDTVINSQQRDDDEVGVSSSSNGGGRYNTRMPKLTKIDTPVSSPQKSEPVKKKNRDAKEDAGEERLEDELDAKLAAIEKEMNELQQLKQEIASMKSSSTTERRRRLLDSGLPGWDAGKLLYKESNHFQDYLDLAQMKTDKVLDNLNTKMVDLLSLNANQLSDLAMIRSDHMIARTDIIRDLIDAMKDRGLDRIGNAQDIIGAGVDKKYAKLERLYDMLPLL